MFQNFKMRGYLEILKARIRAHNFRQNVCTLAIWWMVVIATFRLYFVLSCMLNVVKSLFIAKSNLSYLFLPQFTSQLAAIVFHDARLVLSKVTLSLHAYGKSESQV
jgi:hypothetical protein